MDIEIKNAGRCDRCGGKRQVANVSEAYPYDRRPHYLCLGCAHEIVGALIKGRSLGHAPRVPRRQPGASHASKGKRNPTATHHG